MPRSTKFLARLRKRYVERGIPWGPGALLDTMHQAESRFIGGNEATLLTDGVTAFPEMLAAIEEASEEILLETYIFEPDNTGKAFQEKLLGRLRAGVRVLIIYDSFGSSRARDLLGELGSAGAELMEFNPLDRWRGIRGWHKRDHRKILVVDRRVGFTGGMNIGDEYYSDRSRRGWRDTQVKIEGPAAAELGRVFWENWERRTPPRRSSKALRTPPAGKKKVLIIRGRARADRRAIRAVYLVAIRHAQRRIFITNAYFIPDGRIRRALERAVGRGVDVRVLLGAKSDVAPAHFASRALFGRMLRKGIRIYEYLPRVLHAKTAVVDAYWSTIGTSNLDNRSFLHNLEVNAVVADTRFGERMEEVFWNDLAQSREVSPALLKKRPRYKRLLDRFFYLFRYWL